MMISLQALVLAAGKSTRLNTSLTKLCFPLCGQELISYPLTILSALGIKTTVIVGYQKEAVLEVTKNFQEVTHIEQTIQKGTGHAVLITKHLWTADSILILNGDAPLLEKEQIAELIDRHYAHDATISFITAYNADPSITGYGRVITENGQVSIVEQRDFTGNPATECRLNAGIYLIKRSFLESELPLLEAHSSHGEIYITDLIKKASEKQLHIEIVDAPFDSIRGVNTLKELWIAEHIKKSALISYWMNKGVRFLAPQTVHIDSTVTIGSDSSIGSGVQLRGATTIGNNVSIDAYSIVDNARIHDNAIIHSHCVISDSEIHNAAQVGPFAHVKNESTLHPESIIGNFVEVTKSSVGKKSKAKHLTYLGQAQIGSQVNIGAGAITCNYNGFTKHVTVIKDQAFIGTNSSLIAPVIIGEGALVAAGSVITKDVPADALAIARAEQVNKKLYVSKIKEKYERREAVAAAKKLGAQNTCAHDTNDTVQDGTNNTPGNVHKSPVIAAGKISSLPENTQ